MNIVPKQISKFATLNILHVMNDGFAVSFPLLLPFIKTDLQLNLAQVGFLGSMLNLLGVFLAIPAGIIAAKWGGLKSLTYAVILYSIGFIVASVAPHYFFIVVAFLIASFGFGIFHPIGFASIASWSSKKTRGKDMGNFTAIGDIGRVGISAGITALAAYIGWRLTSGLYGAAALVIFVLLLLSTPKDETSIEQQKRKSVPYKNILQHLGFILASLTGALDSFASSSLYVFIPFLLISKGVNLAILGTFTGFFFIGNFIGKSMLGRFVDKFGNIKVFVAAELFMAINIILFTISHNWILVTVIAVILGALTKGTIPVSVTMLAEATEKDFSHEQVFALNALIASVATAIAPLLYGFIADKFGIINVFVVSAIFAIFAIFSAFLLRTPYNTLSTP